MAGKKFNKKERLYLYQFLIDMFDSGLPIFDSLQKLSLEGGGLLGKGFLKKVDRVIENMKSNSSIANSFASFLPESDIGVFVAADRAGDLRSGLSALIELNTFRSECFASLRSALMLPVILTALTFVVIAGYSTNVFPAFIPVIEVAKWPTSTALLYNFGVWIASGGWVVLLSAAIIFAISLVFLMKNLTGALRESLGKFPPFSTYRKFIMTDLLVSLYLLLRSGIPYLEALKIIEDNCNRFTRWHLRKVINNLGAGLGYGEAMKTGLLDKQTVFDFAIYAELPSFVETLSQISAKAQKGLLLTFQVTAGTLKNIATAFLGGVIIWVFTALFALIDVLSVNMS